MATREPLSNTTRWHSTILPLAFVVGCTASDQGNNAALDAKKEAAISNTNADRATDYLPKVTRDDVLRVIRRDFRGNKPELILGILDGYGSEEWQPEKDRVQLAILKLSHGDVERIRELVDTARSDFRDVIAPAEYPGFSEVGFVGVEKMSRDEVARLKADDWRQYQEWLSKE
jgi:hypothetical protein